MLDYQNLEALREWKFLLSSLEKLKREFQDRMIRCLECGDHDGGTFLAGKVRMLEEIEGYAKSILMEKNNAS